MTAMSEAFDGYPGVPSTRRGFDVAFDRIPYCLYREHRTARFSSAMPNEIGGV